MYAVIFRAKLAHGDDEYYQTAVRLRDLAFGKYGCLDFVSTQERGEEIAISYWEDKQHIREWKNDPEHLKAQQKGRDLWYQSYRVEVCKVEKSY
jgi:heme-degrading monooxygenase HmoA